MLHNAAHKKIDLLQQQLAQSKDECERWSSRNRKARQRKQSTKLTRDNVLVVAPVKCQQVNRDVAALEDELEVLKECLEDRPVPGGQAGPWRTGRSLEDRSVPGGQAGPWGTGRSLEDRPVTGGQTGPFSEDQE